MHGRADAKEAPDRDEGLRQARTQDRRLESRDAMPKGAAGGISDGRGDRRASYVRLQKASMMTQNFSAEARRSG